jgi:hypothetical protein
MHDGIQVLSIQKSAADSSGPKVHIFFGAIGHLLVDNDVSQIQTSAGLEHTKYFLSNVKCIVVEGDFLSCSFPEFRVDSPKFSSAGTEWDSMAWLKSTPYTRPSGPVLPAAIRESVPSPQPRSRTAEPAGISAKTDTLDTPLKRATEDWGWLIKSSAGYPMLLAKSKPRGNGCASCRLSAALEYASRTFSNSSLPDVVSLTIFQPLRLELFKY